MHTARRRLCRDTWKSSTLGHLLALPFGEQVIREIVPIQC
jgi:hypothetical protein